MTPTVRIGLWMSALAVSAVGCAAAGFAAVAGPSWALAGVTVGAAGLAAVAAWAIAARLGRSWDRTESDLQLLNERMRPVEELEEAFLSNVAHEFRSPLSAIKGYVDLMVHQKKDFSPRHQEYLSIIQQSVERLRHFVDNLIDLTKIDRNLMNFQPESLNVKDVMAAAVQAEHYWLIAHRILPSIQVTSRLTVWADPMYLRKVLHQVISNAIHFTPDGGRLTLWAREDGQKTVVMGITDTGVGVPRNMFERIFKKFEQAGPTRNKVRKAGGVGLGLSIVQRLIESQSGRVWVERSSSRGTTIAWTLPRSGSPESAESAAPGGNVRRAA